jgi:Serine endopeptidase inhibitors
VKDSSIKFSLSTLTLLGLAAIASTPALATSSAQIGENAHPQSTQTQSNEPQGKDLPFFARFLEGQQPESANKKVALTDNSTSPGDTGSNVMTRKYPSDAEDNTGGGNVTTAKYPSDAEDNPQDVIVNGTTNKYPSDAEDNTGGGIVTTRKYPSDAEDNTGGGIVTTQKYPSDAEDGAVGYPRRQR